MPGYDVGQVMLTSIGHFDLIVLIAIFDAVSERVGFVAGTEASFMLIYCPFSCDDVSKLCVTFNHAFHRFLQFLVFR